MVSFDVSALYTNVPIAKTAEILKGLHFNDPSLHNSWCSRRNLFGSEQSSSPSMAAYTNGLAQLPDSSWNALKTQCSCLLPSSEQSGGDITIIHLLWSIKLPYHNSMPIYAYQKARREHYLYERRRWQQITTALPRLFDQHNPRWGFYM